MNFRLADIGHPPAGFSQALTGGGGEVSWIVRATPASPTGGPVLVQESADETSYRFPLCIDDAVSVTDASVEVKFMALGGNVDQAAGIVLRYQPENYYVARANALEDNVSLFKTIDGNRLKIAEVPAKVSARQWHTLRFDAVGGHLAVAMDGQPLIAADDSTLTKAGKVGLWTKADSVSAFADLRITPSP